MFELFCKLNFALPLSLSVPYLVQEIEHCYYHGTVKDYPGASAAFHTCNGVSGVIHVGNETFVIHPFYGGDLSQKHPHVIFEARTKSNKGCANSGNLEWRTRSIRRGSSHHAGLVELIDRNGAGRYRRDVRETTKYIETALIIDKAMFQKRNGSTRTEVVHDAIQVANIADLYFRTLNTRVSVVYIETWQGQNQAQIDGGKDISKAISNFNDYTSRNLYKIDKDTTQLLTGETFAGGEVGMSVPETVCTPKAVGISVDMNPYEPHLLAGTMAHMIGHNIGMGHDDNRDECICRDWHGCIMSQSIVGLENVQPYKFSECSRLDYIDALRIGHGLCLLNKPNEV
uniref:Peptidase M12B domain-containing protein n=1 Tax=Anopheles maculatus TaxID=74869 RepID=A0A182SQ98_9DIPT